MRRLLLSHNVLCFLKMIPDYLSYLNLEKKKLNVLKMSFFSFFFSEFSEKYLLGTSRRLQKLPFLSGYF